LLGGTITRRTADSAFVEATGQLLVFRAVPDYKPSTWPSSDVPLQFHFECVVDDPDTAAEQGQRDRHGGSRRTSVLSYPKECRSPLLKISAPLGTPAGARPYAWRRVVTSGRPLIASSTTRAPSGFDSVTDTGSSFSELAHSPVAGHAVVQRLVLVPVSPGLAGPYA